MAELRQRIDADQRLLIQFSEEKVQLAVQGYDLLEAHYNQLNKDIADFSQELQVRASVGRQGRWGKGGKEGGREGHSAGARRCCTRGRTGQRGMSSRGGAGRGVGFGSP